MRSWPTIGRRRAASLQAFCRLSSSVRVQVQIPFFSHSPQQSRYAHSNPHSRQARLFPKIHSTLGVRLSANPTRLYLFALRRPCADHSSALDAHHRDQRHHGVAAGVVRGDDSGHEEGLQAKGIRWAPTTFLARNSTADSNPQNPIPTPKSKATATEATS